MNLTPFPDPISQVSEFVTRMELKMDAGRVFHHWIIMVLLMLVCFSAAAVEPPFRTEQQGQMANLYDLKTGELIADRVRRANWMDGYWQFVRDGRKGIIDRGGRVVAPADYDEIERSEQAAFYIVGRDGKYGVIDLEGHVRVPLEYEEIDEHFTDGYPWVVRRDSKEGLMDPADQHLRLEMRYESILLRGGFALVTNPEADNGPRYQAFDLQGRLVPGAESDEQIDVWGPDLLIVDGERVVALDGREVVSADQFASIRLSSEIRAIVVDKDRGKAGAIDRGGRLIVPMQWDYLEPLSSSHQGWMRAVTSGMPQAGGKVGVIDAGGRIILEPRWDGVELHDAESGTPYFRALLDGKTWFLDLNDRPLFAQPFDEVRQIDREGGYVVESGDKVGLCTNVALADCPIPLEFDSLLKFDQAPSGLWVAQKDGRLGVLQQTDGHVVVPLAYDFLQVSPESTVFRRIAAAIDEVEVVARKKPLNGTLVLRVDEHGSWQMTDEDLDRRPENWQVLAAQAACPAVPIFDSVRAMSEWRALMVRWRAGLSQAGHNRSSSALDDSVANGSRAQSFVAALLVQPWQLLGQPRDADVHDLDEVLSEMLEHAAPVRSGGQYPEADVEFADVCAEVWYLRIPTLERAVEHRGETSPLTQGYALPDAGTLKRDIYPFITVVRTPTGLRLAGISKELGQVLRWSYERLGATAGDTTAESRSAAAAN